MVLILKTNFCAKQESQTNMELEKQENLFFFPVANWLSFVEQKGKKEEVRATVDDETWSLPSGQVSSEEEVVDRQCMEIGPLDEVENQHCVSVGVVMKERKILRIVANLIYICDDFQEEAKEKRKLEEKLFKEQVERKKEEEGGSTSTEDEDAGIAMGAGWMKACSSREAAFNPPPMLTPEKVKREWMKFLWVRSE